MLPLSPDDRYKNSQIFPSEKRPEVPPTHPQKDFKNIIDSKPPKPSLQDQITIQPQDPKIKKDGTSPEERDISSGEAKAKLEELPTDINLNLDLLQTREEEKEPENTIIYIELTPEQTALLNKIKAGDQAFSTSEEAESTQKLQDLMNELNVEKATKSSIKHKILMAENAVKEETSSKTQEPAYYLAITPDQANRLQELNIGELIPAKGRQKEALTPVIDLLQSLTTATQNILDGRKAPADFPLAKEAMQGGGSTARTVVEPRLVNPEKSMQDRQTPFIQDLAVAKTQAPSGVASQEKAPTPIQRVTETYDANPVSGERATTLPNNKPIYIELNPEQAGLINSLKAQSQIPSSGNAETIQKLKNLLQELPLEKTSQRKSEPSVDMVNLEPANRIEGAKTHKNYYYLELSPEQVMKLQELNIGRVPLPGDNQGKSLQSTMDLFKNISIAANDLLTKRESPTASTPTLESAIANPTQPTTSPPKVERPSSFDLPMESPVAYEQQATPMLQRPSSIPFPSEQISPDISALEPSKSGGGANLSNREVPLTKESKPIEGQTIERRQIPPKSLEGVYTEGRQMEPKIIERKPSTLGTAETRSIAESYSQTATNREGGRAEPMQNDSRIGEKTPSDLRAEGTRRPIEGIAAEARPMTGQPTEGRPTKERPLGQIPEGSSTRSTAEEGMMTSRRNQPETQFTTIPSPLSANLQEGSPSKTINKRPETGFGTFNTESPTKPLQAEETPLKTQPLGVERGASQPEEIRSSRQNKESGKERSVEAETVSAASTAPPPLQTEVPIQAQPAEVKSFSKEEIIKLINELVDQIMVVKIEGQTDTVVTLRSPKLLEGSTLKIAFDKDAPGQVNITFSNLTPEAKRLLDDNLAKDSLSDSLKNRADITVHNIITTTQDEIPAYAQPEVREREQEGGDRQQEGDREERE